MFESHGVKDGQPEFEARDALGTGQVQQARGGASLQFDQGLGSVADVQGRAEFIVEQPRFLSALDGLEQAVGGAESAAARVAVEQGQAHDQGTRVSVKDGLFAAEFGAAVERQGLRRRGFGEARGGGANGTEDEIR